MEGIGRDACSPVIEVEIGCMKRCIGMDLPTKLHQSTEMMA
jgi:hypothetical protein